MGFVPSGLARPTWSTPFLVFGPLEVGDKGLSFPSPIASKGLHSHCGSKVPLLLTFMGGNHLERNVGSQAHPPSSVFLYVALWGWIVCRAAREEDA